MSSFLESNLKKLLCSYDCQKFKKLSYLRSQEDSRDFLDKNACGLFTHPSVGEDINKYVVIQDHKIQFTTVDLA
ncbi:5-methylcytosine-specific restriction enzyme subunit McrC [Psychrobacter phenylpyruvicus]|uniref:5-methylcytosine-specific restriction enzyme subunit McrC n=1 Tax=Psychrobacter phenylpyruvicus TaxID=29432 RepID=A0A379LMJ3_9GAMM|nr:5-methylcytosine-specific restriction enzyme subunit McrC [Psychrobacter phenylpyruvicus]